MGLITKRPAGHQDHTMWDGGATLTYSALTSTGRTMTMTKLGAGEWGWSSRFKDVITRGPWVDVRAYHAAGSEATTNGTAGAGSTSITVNSAGDFRNKQHIRIARAGAAGADYVATLNAGQGTTSWTLPRATTGAVTGATIWHDDTAAIQAAIDHYGSNTKVAVFIPPGTYICGDLSASSSTSCNGFIMGVPGESIIKARPSVSNMLLISKPYYLTVSGLWFEPVSDTTMCMTIRGAQTCAFRDLMVGFTTATLSNVSGVELYGVAGYGCYYNEFSNIRIRGVGNKGLSLKTATGVARVNANSFQNVAVSNCRYGVKIESALGNSFVSPTLEDNNYGIYISTNADSGKAHRNKFYGLYLESNASYHIINNDTTNSIGNVFDCVTDEISASYQFFSQAGQVHHSTRPKYGTGIETYNKNLFYRTSTASPVIETWKRSEATPSFTMGVSGKLQWRGDQSTYDNDLSRHASGWMETGTDQIWYIQGGVRTRAIATAGASPGPPTMTSVRTAMGGTNYSAATVGRGWIGLYRSSGATPWLVVSSGASIFYFKADSKVGV